MRILYLVSERWPTHRADILILFGKYMPQQGIYSDLVALSDCSSNMQEPWTGGESRFACFPSSRVGKYLRRIRHNLSVLWASHPPHYDAIQVRDMPLTAIFGLLAARHRRLPFYYWMSYAIPEGDLALARARGIRSGIYYLAPLIRGVVGRGVLYRLVLPRCDHIFVQSERMRDDVVGHGIERTKMTPVPMCVDLEQTTLEDTVAPLDTDLLGRRIVLYLGTLHQSRRIEMLFDMIRLVAASIPEVMLVIVGDIEDRRHMEWLRTEAINRGAANFIHWTGWLPVMEAWRYVRSAEVALSPFPQSPELDGCSPTKVVEYLAFGIPVVANRQPDQERVIRESGGGICVDWSADAFAEAVTTLLNDRVQASARGAAGQAYVSRERNYRHLSKRLSRVYHDLAQGALAGREDG